MNHVTILCAEYAMDEIKYHIIKKITASLSQKWFHFNEFNSIPFESCSEQLFFVWFFWVSQTEFSGSNDLTISAQNWFYNKILTVQFNRS